MCDRNTWCLPYSFCCLSGLRPDILHCICVSLVFFTYIIKLHAYCFWFHRKYFTAFHECWLCPLEMISRGLGLWYGDIADSEMKAVRSIKRHSQMNLIKNQATLYNTHRFLGIWLSLQNTNPRQDSWSMAWTWKMMKGVPPLWVDSR